MAAQQASDVRALRRKMSAEERRDEIVRTAAQLFDKAGYARTTMDDIAREVGIAKPTLYHYFASKDLILYGIHDEFIDVLIEQHEQRLRAGLGPEQLLLEAMADILELMETRPGHVRVFFEHFRELPPEQQEPIRAKRDHYQRLLNQVFADGVEAGTFTTNPRLAALAMFGMCNWAYQWYRPGGKMRSREIAYQFWDILMHGVGGAPPARATVSQRNNRR